MQTPTNVFIVNLAASDVLMCLFAVPLTPIHAFMDDWIFGEILCKLFPTTQVNETDKLLVLVHIVYQDQMRTDAT